MLPRENWFTFVILLVASQCFMLVVYAASLLCAMHVCSGLVVRALTSVQKVFALIPAGNKNSF